MHHIHTTQGISFCTSPLRPAPAILAEVASVPIPTILTTSSQLKAEIPNPCSAVCKASNKPLAVAEDGLVIFK